MMMGVSTSRLRRVRITSKPSMPRIFTSGRIRSNRFRAAGFSASSPPEAMIASIPLLPTTLNSTDRTVSSSSAIRTRSLPLQSSLQKRVFLYNDRIELRTFPGAAQGTQVYYNLICGVASGLFRFLKAIRVLRQFQENIVQQRGGSAVLPGRFSRSFPDFAALINIKAAVMRD